VKNQDMLDEYIVEAISSKSLKENLGIIKENNITAVQVQSIADIENDLHWQARNLIVEVTDDQGSLKMQNVFPFLSATPGEIRWPGKSLGADNQAVYCEELGLSAEEFDHLEADGVI